ncbi:MAG: HEAT repeat domain-containing protein [Nitrospinae bacterium]|nr:HEAT repeat domain-containing protein [Nitrospinota bacterium]
MRIKVVRALEAIGDADAGKILRQMTRDPNPDVAEQATRALAVVTAANPPGGVKGKGLVGVTNRPERGRGMPRPYQTPRATILPLSRRGREGRFAATG